MSDQDPMALPRIALISVARSGTTHLLRLASALEDIYVVKNEWLNCLGVSWAEEEQLAEFRRVNGVDYTDHTDERLRTWVRKNKEQTLQILETLASPTDQAVIYKSFPTDVAVPEFDTLFYNRPNTQFVFLIRRPIDSFISLTKAQAIGKWVSADTTALKPELDADDYLTWWAHTSDWFTGLQARLEADNRPYGSLSYEDDVMPGIDHMLERLIEELKTVGFDSRVKRTDVAKTRVKRLVRQIRGKEIYGNLGAVKQDKAKHAAEKVSNWEDFVQQIEDKTGSLECLKAFMPQAEQVFWSAKSLHPDVRSRSAKGV